MRLFCYVGRMTGNLESKDIVVADEVTDFGAESSEGTTGVFEFSSKPKGNDEVKRKNKHSVRGSLNLLMTMEDQIERQS
ncbi:hypothetical protein OIU79_000681, partial [Salix purpurea]